MPLPPPVAREPIHTRRIELQGYRRVDGLWDVEAHLTDRKSYHYENRWRGRLEIGEPIHDMALRVTIDDAFLIHAVEAAMDATPFPSCPGAAPSYQSLVGLRMGPGWINEARRRIRRTEGCTHLSELLAALATAAFQTIAPLKRGDPRGTQRRLVNSCHGWRRDGEAVAAVFPDLADKE